MTRFTHNLSFTIGICCLTSCCGSSHESENHLANMTTISDSLGAAMIDDPANLKNTSSQDTNTVIGTGKMSLAFDGLLIYEVDQKRLSNFTTDTIIFYISVGEMLSGQTMTITSTDFTDFSVEERFETSVTVTNEGPHCDLTEWKHYLSEWKSLKKDQSGKFITEIYAGKETSKFPVVEMKDLTKVAIEKCGEHWSEPLRNATSPKEYPCSVGISRYFLRITGQRADNGEPVIRTVILEQPMGC